MRAGIAGAGVLGRLMAWRLARQGHEVDVFDPAAGPQAPPLGRIDTGSPAHAAGFTAAGLLSPLAESEHAAPEITALGWRSLALWRDITTQLAASGTPALMRERGSLLLAHTSDLGAAQRVLARLRSEGAPAAPQVLDAAALAALEPTLSPRLHAWLLPGEAQLLPRETLQALCATAPSVRWHWEQRVATVRPGQLVMDSDERLAFDLAIDTRGLGAKDALLLRGVRGELLWLHAPGVALSRPLRLVHPRHRVYLVPRPDGMIVVGASEIESEDRSPISLKAAVELMAAAHSVLPALAEARIAHMETNLRPALPDHRPCLHTEPGLLRLNGGFRHGWLVAPALVDDALKGLGHAC